MLSEQQSSESDAITIHELRAEVQTISQELASLRETLGAVHGMLSNRPLHKDSYTTAELAEILGRKPYTVREWCRLQRINAFKADCGRGIDEEWRISHEELVRIQNEGLLPSRYAITRS